MCDKLKTPVCQTFMDDRSAVSLSDGRVDVEYRDFVDGVNAGKIKKVVFSIKNYGHYRNCVMVSKRRSPKGKMKMIWFYLTPDGYEKVFFWNTIKEKCKVFRLKNKGTFSLLQMWDRIEIHAVEYATAEDDLPASS